MNKSKTQFSLRAGVALTAVSAVWVWIFRETKPSEMAVLAGIAVTAGIVGHVVYTRWLPWRVTVIATVLLIYNALIGAPALLQSGSENPLVFLFEVAVLPTEMIKYARSPREILFSVTMVLGTLIFSPAHPMRPCLPSAIITALGIGIWYGNSILMMVYGG